MAGAAPARGALQTLTPLLLLLLLPGSLCQKHTTATPPPASHGPLNSVTVGTNGSGVGAWGGPGCAGTGILWVTPGPTSLTGTAGKPLSLECRYRASTAAEVTWYRVCPQRVGGGGSSGEGCRPGEVVAEQQEGRQERHEEGLATLTFPHLSHNDSGLYFCCVQAAGGDAGHSCGTFVRVVEPMASPLLDIAESTKNRIIQAEGILLLLSTVGPGLVLLFRKRWANERLLQRKKSICEEENLYEGLNVDECSMYEDISRGAQPTYQDVGGIPADDTQLEKP